MLAVCVAFAIGCGDRCQNLCNSVANRVEDCRPESITWIDLGATSRDDYEDSCRDQWDRVRLDLSANDLRLALEDCADANKLDQALTCEEIVALYGP